MVTKRLMPAPVRQLLHDLRIEAERRKELPPVPSEAASEARSWLVGVVVDLDRREEHLALLRELYGLPVERGNGCPQWPFLRWGPLPVAQIEAIAEEGPTSLPGGRDLSRLLLDPFALDSLIELVSETVTDGWFDRLADAGAEMVARHDLKINLPEPPQPSRRQQLPGVGHGAISQPGKLS